MCLKAMFGIGVSSFATETVIYDFLRYLPLLLICAVAATPLPRRLFEYLRGRFSAVRFASPVLMAASFFVAVAYMVDSTFSPFLYYIF